MVKMHAQIVPADGDLASKIVPVHKYSTRILSRDIHTVHGQKSNPFTVLCAGSGSAVPQSGRVFGGTVLQMWV